MARKSSAYARLPITPQEEPEEALSALVSPTELSIPSATEGSPYGVYGEEEGQLTGGAGLEAEKLDWTPVSDEQAQQWEEEKRTFNAEIELRMLRDDMLNSRRDLIDKLYDGVDPSLQNTKPVINELLKMELKTLNETVGDLEEMTPEQKLRVASAKINLGKDVRARVETDKQNNVNRLNSAVSEYNATLKTQMAGIQGELAAIQEKHTALAEEEIKAGATETKARITADKELDRAKERLLRMQIQIDKMKEPPSPETIKAYNKIAEKLDAPTIDISLKDDEAWKGTWYKPWTWLDFGGEEEEEVDPMGIR